MIRARVGRGLRPCFCKSSVIGSRLRSFVFLWSVAAFALQGAELSSVRGTVGPIKSKRVGTWPFPKKVCSPALRMEGA